MSKKIKIKDIETGKVRYFNEEDVINEPMSWGALIKQGLIDKVSTKSFSSMTEEEQKLFTDLGGEIEDDNTEK